MATCFGPSGPSSGHTGVVSEAGPEGPKHAAIKYYNKNKCYYERRNLNLIFA
jgi:hypothetical protein